MGGRGHGVLGLLLVVGCGAVLKPPAPDRRLNVLQTGSVFEANNGYRFAVIPEPQSSVVRLDVRYPVGAADDPKGKEGLAHLVEHLLFDVEYSKAGTRTSINAELGRVALSWNAETHEDYTTYQTLLAPEYLDDVVGLEVNRIAIGCAGLTEDIFAREREVVLNELRQRQGASGAQLRRVIQNELYPQGHPYREVDSVETVAKLKLADACDFLQNRYQRGKAIVVASGNVTEKEIQLAASKQFVRLRKRIPTSGSAVAQVNPAAGTVRVRADIDDAAMVIATWSLPPVGSSEYRQLELAWPRIKSRLDQFAYMFKWGHSSFTTTFGGAFAPVLAVGISLNSPGDVDEAKSSIEKSVRAAFESLGHDKSDPRWQARFYSRTDSLLARWESLSGRNAMMADFLMFDTDAGYLTGHIAEIQQSSPSSVRSIGARWLGSQHARFLVVEPSGTMAIQAGNAYAGTGGDAHATVVDGSLADSPLEVPAYRPKLRTERYELGNGLHVILWPNGTTPVTRGRLVIDSGTGHEAAGKEGTASMIGASGVELDSVVFESRELSIFVDNLIVELGFELRNPGAPLDDDEKDYVRARLRSKRATERQKYDTDMRTAVYGKGHPYARPLMTEASLDRLHHDQVRDWARDHVVAKNTTLIIAGQFDADLVKKHIAYNLDQVSGGNDSADIPLATPDSGRRFVVGVTEKPSPTVEIDLEFITEPGIDSEYAKRLVLEQVLNGELSKLRSERALTYGFYASWDPRKAGSLWHIGGEADATRAAEAASAMFAILADMRRDPETYRASFVLARQKVLERLLLATSDSHSVVEQLAYMARFDLEDSVFDRLPERVGALTLRDFHAFLVQELPVGAQVFGAFGNASAAEAAVAAARSAQTK
jgi:zinc protease